MTFFSFLNVFAFFIFFFIKATKTTELRYNKKLFKTIDYRNRFVFHNVISFSQYFFMIKFNYTFLFDRKYFVVDSFRRNNFHFFEIINISASYFFLHFKMHINILFLINAFVHDIETFAF